MSVAIPTTVVLVAMIVASLSWGGAAAFVVLLGAVGAYALAVVDEGRR